MNETLFAMPPPSPSRPAAVVPAFYRRTGRSGRSFLMSVYPIGACPDYVDAVVVATRGDGSLVWAGDSGAGGEAFARVLKAAAARGASRVEIHLLAADPAARESVLDDLRARPEP